MHGEETREKLIEVARQLFVKSGVENTTMNDIALAAGKVRRTLYTYFKSKEDIYWAVVESEITLLLDKLNNIVNEDLPPEEKLSNYIFCRLELIKEIVARNGTLRSEFFRDIWKVEHAWKNIDQQEISLLRAILQEGVDKGDFNVPNIRISAVLIHYALRGFDAPYIRNHFQRMCVDKEQVRSMASNLILNGVKAKETMINATGNRKRGKKID
ncbi:MAG: TetR/AcrR family transcriptional regulator [Rikenellaceae bacterium]